MLLPWLVLQWRRLMCTHSSGSARGSWSQSCWWIWEKPPPSEMVFCKNCFLYKMREPLAQFIMYSGKLRSSECWVLFSRKQNGPLYIISNCRETGDSLHLAWWIRAGASWQDSPPYYTRYFNLSDSVELHHLIMIQENNILQSKIGVEFEVYACHMY